jgi:hypothetical protein
MPDSFAVRFATARDRRGPLAIGADPHGQVLGKWGLTDDADGLERFTDIVLSAAADTVGLIKPQSACDHANEGPAGRASRFLLGFVADDATAGDLFRVGQGGDDARA